MSFRARLLLAFLAVVLIPMVIFAVGIRRATADRLTAQYERRVDALVEVIEEDLALESDRIAGVLASLRSDLVDDNRLRRALVGGLPGERPFLIDYAGEAMRLTGLAMLQIQDEDGRIISSGHFRNEYDRLEPELPRRLAAAPGGLALVRAQTAVSPFLALARVDSFNLGAKRYSVIGGLRVDAGFLARLTRDDELTVSVVYPGGTLSSADARPPGPSAAAGSEADSEGEDLDSRASDRDQVVGELPVPFIISGDGDGATVLARVVVTQTLTPLAELRRSIDIWFAVSLIATALGALLLASWLSSKISRPLTELAEKTARIDLDRLDIEFDSRRRDEVGVLSRLLGAMIERLRASAAGLKEAERRATLGELARQVNHDIKNGLIPIRNVVRHLTEVARRQPDELGAVFDERHGTLESSIVYLENLASNYARLYPRLVRGPCDLNAVIRQVVSDVGGGEAVELQLDLDENLPAVLGDAVVLRRIVENLLQNGLDSFDSDRGTVKISTGRMAAADGPDRIRVVIADDGRGMSEQQLERAFDDFYTTKEEGTGLGLSIVRRLVLDLSGTISVESTEGEGSRFVVEFPGIALPTASQSEGGAAEGGGE